MNACLLSGDKWHCHHTSSIINNTLACFYPIPTIVLSTSSLYLLSHIYLLKMSKYLMQLIKP